MVILNSDHPDVEQFIWCKAKEEKKAHALVDAGYDSSLDGEAYSSVFFQNANNSVRASDQFMQAAVNDADWWTRSVVTGQPVRRYKARELMRQIAEATHQCGDPGMQFDTTINRWHTSKATARINASNPCSEYMFLDDSACNLASLNLMKFVGPDGTFNVEAFRNAVDTVIIAQEILVDNASYPTEKIAKNSHDFRPLGLGYANLGALLMSLGLPYDSDQGRDFAAAITAIMCGQAYLTSARVAEAVGPCPGYPENEDSFLDVIRMHWNAVNAIDSKRVPSAMFNAAEECWRRAYEVGSITGFRNAQVTVLAPTGTIGFMMDCDTTGIEPDLALVKYKKLVGGGVIKIVNNTVPQALIKLGYTPEQTEAIVTHIDSTGTIEGAPHVKPEHLAVFDCSFRPQNGTRFIHHMGHIRMMAAVQPFISGAISKTINMPEESTVEDIMEAYTESWKLGLKAVAIYRDGSKRVQPLSSGTGKGEKKSAAPVAPQQQVVEKIVYRPQRRKLPDERQSVTHKFSIGGHEGYITVGLYEDGTPGEVFISMAKEGSTISGLMDTLATSISYGLQYGVPLKFFVDKFSHVRFEPSGWTGNPQVPYAKSIIDYIFRWLGARFLGITEASEAGDAPKLRMTEPDPQVSLPFENNVAGDAPLCSECGSIMTRNGSCYKCENCGGTSGCS
jgi:ribonucleoside-diphosphate reductase alpha chain